MTMTTTGMKAGMKAPDQKLINKARNAAKDAWKHDRYGHGTEDWQDAEVAACEVFQDAGYTNDEAYELGSEVASAVVTELEEQVADEAEKQGLWA
jgi:hypothetical protein